MIPELFTHLKKNDNFKKSMFIFAQFSYSIFQRQILFKITLSNGFLNMQNLPIWLAENRCYERD